MSIINRVLNDIEEQSKVEKKPALGSLEPIYIKELDSSKYLYVVIGMLTAVILGLLWWLFSPMELTTNSDNKPQTSITAKNILSKESASKESVPKENTSKVITPKQLIPQEVPKPAELKQIELKPTVPKQAELKKTVSNVTDSHKTISNKVISSPTLSNDIVPENTNLNVVKKPIEKIEKPIIKAEVTASPKEVNVKKSLSITPVRMSDIAVAKLKLKQGIKAQQNGNIAKAQKMWQDALTIKPDLHEARIQLAASFYGANDLSETMTLMGKAVREFPQYDGYRLMAAQIYYQEKQPEKALGVLNSPFNKIDVATENLVLAGSLAQQLQQWPAAQSNYQVLVNRDINNSQWVLGLAIAHDALGERESAHRYYSRLMSLGNVDQAIREYARKRSSILKTSMNARGYNG